nr:VCBS repeat-containing protein [Alphaproteobacteria bacterium]
GDGLTDVIITDSQGLNDSTGYVAVFLATDDVDTTDATKDYGGFGEFSGHASAPYLLPIAYGGQSSTVHGQALVFKGEDSSAELGTVLAVGDFNNDGSDDVVVTARNGNANNSVFLFYGGTARTNEAQSVVAADGSTEGVEITSGFASAVDFGSRLEVLDFDGDGYDDLLIFDRGQQNIHIVYGQSTQLAGGVGTYELGQASNAAAESRITLGDASLQEQASIDAEPDFRPADVNADGYDDLIVYHTNGVPGENYVQFVYGFARHVDPDRSNEIDGTASAAETLTGTDGVDTGEVGHEDTVSLGAGDDTVTITSSADILALGSIDGGAGYDTVIFDIGDGNELNLFADTYKEVGLFYFADESTSSTADHDDSHFSFNNIEAIEFRSGTVFASQLNFEANATYNLLTGANDNDTSLSLLYWDTSLDSTTKANAADGVGHWAYDSTTEAYSLGGINLIDYDGVGISLLLEPLT